MTQLKEAGDSDEGFLYDVFCTTWEDEIAALPNRDLAHHVLRIQYTAQNRRFQNRYPHHERHVVVHDGQRVGRLYIQRDGTAIHVVDMTLLPQFRSRGIGTELVRMLMTEAAREHRSLTMRVARRNTRAAMLYASLGFSLATVDDLDSYLEWVPSQTPAGRELADTGR